MDCPQCSTPNPEGTRVCVKCSTAIDWDKATLPVVSPDAAASISPKRQPAALSQLPALPDEGAQSAALQPGAVVAERYQIVKLLGDGGVGAVYRAHDLELDRVVALKVIRPELARDAQILQHLKQELMQARQITHPNIIRIFDLGQAQGTRFITMEFVEGEDLSRILARRGKMPAPEAANIIGQVARGLQAAHSEGKVHRDLKPRNIMIDAQGKAWVMDFGIARPTDASNIARTGTVTGTPAYASPEQTQGQSVDARSDLYTLGMIFYELLTGKPPFNAEEQMAMLTQRRHKSPAPPSQVEPSIPKPIDEIVLKMLGPKPEERYQSAAEILTGLDAYEAQRSGRTGTAPTARVREGVPLKYVAVGVTVVLALAGWSFMHRGSEPVTPTAKTVRLLVSDFQNATKDPAFEGTLEPTFALALGDATSISSYSRGDARAIARQLRPDATHLGEKLALLVAAHEGIDVVVSGAIESSSGGYLIRARAVETATGKALLEKSEHANGKQDVLAAVAKLAVPICLALGDTTPESSRLRAAGTYRSTSLEAAQAYANGQELLWDGKQADAIRPFERAIQFDPEMGRAYGGLAVIHGKLGNHTEAERYFKLALARTASMTEREQYLTRGAYYLSARDDQKALAEFSTLIKQFPSDEAGPNNLALSLFNMRDFARAVEEGQHAVRMDPRKSLYRNNVAFYEMYSGRFDEALRDAGEAIKLNPAEPKPYVATALSQFAEGRTAEAEATYRKLSGLSPHGASLASIGLADMALYEGRNADAIAILEKGMAADLEQSSQSPAAAVMMAALAAAYRDKGKAVAAANRSLAAGRNESGGLAAAASALLLSGQEAKALDIAKEIGKRLEPELRSYAKLLEGEAELVKGKTQAAIDLFQEAGQLSDTWIGRLDLGRAYLEAGAFTEASSAFDACEKRKGEATSVFLDGMPTFRYFPQVYYYRARVQEGMKSAAASESYKAFLAIKSKADPSDALVADARRRAKALGVPGL